MNQKPNTRSRQLRSILLAGVLPLVIFTVVEEVWGTLWGLILGMVFGVGEILYERFRLGKVDPITWFGNGALLISGSFVLYALVESIWMRRAISRAVVVPPAQ